MKSDRATFLFIALLVVVWMIVEIFAGVKQQQEREENMVHVNLSDVQTEFEILPEGLYNATLVDAEIIERDDPDKYPYVKWEFKYTDQSGKAWTNTSLSPNALWKLRELLDAVGEDEEILDDEEGFDLDPTDYIGEEVTLHITVGSYKGKPTNQVEEVLALQEEKASKKKKTASASKGKGGGTSKKRRRKVV
jgi:hypothetical protein